MFRPPATGLGLFAEKETDISFVGRLATYRNYNMALDEFDL